MTTVNIDLSVQQPRVELDVAAGQAVLVPKLSAPDLSKMEELVAAAAASETAAGEQAQAAQGSATTASGHAQAAQNSATTASESATTANEKAQAAQGYATTASGHAQAASESATTASGHASAAQASATTAGEAATTAQASATKAETAQSESQQAASAAAGSAVTASEQALAAQAAATTASGQAQAALESAVTASERTLVAQSFATTAGGHATTAQASATNAQVSAQAAAKSLSDMALLVGGNDDLYAKMRLYTQSRLGLIANGSGGMGDNYNFSTMSYTQKDVYFGRGAFISNTLGGIHTTDEKIPLEPDSNYEFSVYARCLEKGDATSTAQGINLARCFDVDGLDILPQHVGMITVKLGAPLQNGDTTVTIHPDDRERMRVWVAANSNGGNVHVANPDYVNSKGYRYERGTNVREIYNTGAATPGASLLYDAGSGVLRMFTINAAPAGGVASNGSITFTKTGSVYVYAIGNMNGTAIPTDKWQRFSGRFSTNTLRPGTAEIVIGCQLNRSSRYGTKTALSAMSLHKVF